MFAWGGDRTFARARDGRGTMTAVTPNIAPWLAVTDGQRALDYYEAAFGAEVRYRYEDDACRVAFAHLSICDADFCLQEYEGSRARSGDGSIRMILTVEDPDA